MKEVLVSWAFRDHSNHQRGDCHGLYFYHDWYDEDDLQIDEWLTSCEAWFAGVMGGHLGHDVSYGTIEHLSWLKSHAKHILTFIQQLSVAGLLNDFPVKYAICIHVVYISCHFATP